MLNRYEMSTMLRIVLERVPEKINDAPLFTSRLQRFVMKCTINETHSTIINEIIKKELKWKYMFHGWVAKRSHSFSKYICETIVMIILCLTQNPKQNNCVPLL